MEWKLYYYMIFVSPIFFQDENYIFSFVEDFYGLPMGLLYVVGKCEESQFSAPLIFIKVFFKFSIEKLVNSPHKPHKVETNIRKIIIIILSSLSSSANWIIPLVQGNHTKLKKKMIMEFSDVSRFVSWNLIWSFEPTTPISIHKQITFRN